MSQAKQAELFSFPARVSALPEGERHKWKSIRQTNGASGRYWKTDGDLIVADFGQGDEIQARWQPSQGGRWRGVFNGRVIWCRGGKGEIRGWLSSAAVIVQLVRQAREMEAMAKAQAEMAARLRASLERFKAGDEEFPVNRKDGRKLCREDETPSKAVFDFIPAKVDCLFSKAPIDLEKHTDRFAKDELRVLRAAWSLAAMTGEFWGEEELSARAHVHPKTLSAIRHSLFKRHLIRKTGKRIARADVWQLVWNSDYYGEYRELAPQGSRFARDGSRTGQTASNPTTKENPPPYQKGNESPTRGANSTPVRAQHDPPKGTRALASGEDSPEHEATGRLSVIVGPTDAVKNRGLWITYYREDAVAFREALGDCENKKREGFKPKTSWGGVMTEAFKRIRDERKGDRA